VLIIVAGGSELAWRWLWKAVIAPVALEVTPPRIIGIACGAMIGILAGPWALGRGLRPERFRLGPRRGSVFHGGALRFAREVILALPFRTLGATAPLLAVARISFRPISGKRWLSLRLRRLGGPLRESGSVAGILESGIVFLPGGCGTGRTARIWPRRLPFLVFAAPVGGRILRIAGLPAPEPSRVVRD
jgi:hypothetical protein